MIKENEAPWSDFPICPWCEEEIDKDILQDIDDKDLLKIDDFDLIRCPSCGENIEIKCSLVYCTYKADKEDSAEEKLVYDVQNNSNGYNGDKFED